LETPNKAIPKTLLTINPKGLSTASPKIFYKVVFSSERASFTLNSHKLMFAG